MKTQTMIFVAGLTAILLAPVDASRAVATASDELMVESPDGAVTLVIGRVTKVDGQVFTLEEEGGSFVQVQVTPDTQGPKAVRIGEQVMVSLLPSGAASVITSAEGIADAEPLHVGEAGAR